MTQFDSPYRDDPPTRAPSPRETPVRPAPTRAADAAPRSAPRARDAARSDAPRREPARRETARQEAPRREAAASAAPPRARQRAGSREAPPRPAPTPAPVEGEPTRRRRGRRRRGEGGTAPLQLTSHPTGRAAYAETRAWLLAQHGPVCAYCGRKFTPGVMTLDHVAPRRGQSAYDRRDNLVLACPGCNAAKRDLAPLAFLLGARPRAANLLRYGSHLSHGLLELARSLVPEHEAADAAEVGHSEGYPPSLLSFDGDSPYSD